MLDLHQIPHFGRTVAHEVGLQVRRRVTTFNVSLFLNRSCTLVYTRYLS